MVKKLTHTEPSPTRTVESLIHVVRGQKVMLDNDLAALYGVATKALNQAVRRNAERFPADFMFQLTSAEAAAMRSQFVTASKINIKVQPLAFTEHGVTMLASVLRSARAVEMSIAIVRAFVRMRALMASNQEFATRMEKMERTQQRTSSVIEVLVEDIDRLAQHVKKIKSVPTARKQRIGFQLAKGK